MAGKLLGAIVEEIWSSPNKRIPFARFMEQALYHPRWGYYRREGRKIGREGDFFTSPYAGELFGLTLSRVIGRLARRFPTDRPWAVVEMGGGDGRLAEQVIRGLAQRGLSHPPVYWMIETSSYHRRLQRERLKNSPWEVQWIDSVETIPAGTPAILFSNELVDAFPVHRVRKREGCLREIYVTWNTQDTHLEEVEGPLSRPELAAYFAESGRNLVEGGEAEVPLAAREWIQQIGGWLEQGILLTIDYGGTSLELDSPLRREGTLRGFRKHRLVTDLLSQPGETDLTADVCFTALRRWGEEAGLFPQWYGSQSRFLLEAGILEELTPPSDADPFSPEAKRIRSLRQLALPGGMGEQFRVLIQAKGQLIPADFLAPGEESL
ncbi:class I SAM-dependent methyltransferase [Salinithrix halophila]|uniref:Class I SAM-dependent methyltransferase n=1 Tax=Salinithrix halophila TaxID=1485204 RepID=A0ABV8JE17_9BACL